MSIPHTSRYSLSIAMPAGIAARTTTTTTTTTATSLHATKSIRVSISCNKQTELNKWRIVPFTVAERTRDASCLWRVYNTPARTLKFAGTNWSENVRVVRIIDHRMYTTWATIHLIRLSTTAVSSFRLFSFSHSLSLSLLFSLRLFFYLCLALFIFYFCLLYFILFINIIAKLVFYTL